MFNKSEQKTLKKFGFKQYSEPNQDLDEFLIENI